MYLQEIGDTLIGVDLILHPREAVTFILVNLQLRHAALLLDGIGHLLRFARGQRGSLPPASSSSGALI